MSIPGAREIPDPDAGVARLAAQRRGQDEYDYQLRFPEPVPPDAERLVDPQGWTVGFRWKRQVRGERRPPA